MLGEVQVCYQQHSLIVVNSGNCAVINSQMVNVYSTVCQSEAISKDPTTLQSDAAHVLTRAGTLLPN